jgi:imidazolonepropionase
MTSLALTGIGLLATCDPEHGRGPLGLVERAAIVIDEGRIAYAGRAPGAPTGTDALIDLAGRCVMPGFVDSHTHPIFAGDRAEEFARRMAGRPYQPGGILDTVAATRAATPDDLEASARRLIGQALASGTTTVEIKTGYGLTPTDEALHLDIARSLSPETTFLGAHLVPAEFASDRHGYLRLLTETMIPSAAATARWCDAFCETGAFDVEESRAVLTAAAARGMGLRVHANQLGPTGGVGLACELGAASADHCTHLTSADIEALAGSDTVATLLPISDFCTRQPYPDGRALLDAGARVAVASNCNPGSSYSTSIPVALALAVRECGLTIDEALLAVTRGGAAALRRSDVGRLVPGARADVLVLDAPHPRHLVYRLGAPLVAGVLKDGAWVVTLAGGDNLAG